MTLIQKISVRSRLDLSHKKTWKLGCQLLNGSGLGNEFMGFRLPVISEGRHIDVQVVVRALPLIKRSEFPASPCVESRDEAISMPVPGRKYQHHVGTPVTIDVCTGRKQACAAMLHGLPTISG